MPSILPKIALLPGAFLAVLATHEAAAQTPAPIALAINTGGEAGAYHASFCPVLAARMRESGVAARCIPSGGTRENLERVLANPGQFAYGQLDVFALEAGLLSARQSFQIVRQDDARECLFAVTRNQSITSFGALSAAVKNMRVILPPKESGSAGTFQYLRHIDEDGLGRARSTTFAASLDEAIKETLASDDTVTFFVQFPDGEH